MELSEIIALSLGGGGFISILTYIAYQICNKKCSSHLEVNGKSISIDYSDVNEIILKAETPQKREEIKTIIHNEIKLIISRIKSSNNILELLKKNVILQV